MITFFAIVGAVYTALMAVAFVAVVLSVWWARRAECAAEDAAQAGEDLDDEWARINLLGIWR